MMQIIGYILLLCGWNILYIYSIVYQAHKKEHIIPSKAVASNFAWEIMASIYIDPPEKYIAIIWGILDMFIVIFLLRERTFPVKKKIGFGVIFLISFVIFCYFFININHGWEITVFIIDLTMAIFFLYDIRTGHETSSDQNFVFVASLKLAGDFGAWIVVSMWQSTLPVTHYLAAAVLVCNLIYLYLAIKKHQVSTKRGSKCKLL